jgi:hypothetical protein
MLAYLLWHRPREGVEREAYERAAEHFHRSLAHAPPAGFRGSALYRVGQIPSLAGPGEPSAAGAVSGAVHGTAYEDWYLVEDFTALGVLNEAAVAHGHRGAHDEIARRFGAGAGGLYGLLEGHAGLGARRGTASLKEVAVAIWIARPPGAQRGELAQLLGDGMDPERASLWRRSLVLGPAPEYCLLGPEPPAGVAPTRLPEGWRAIVTPREVVWSG